LLVHQVKIHFRQVRQGFFYQACYSQSLPDHPEQRQAGNVLWNFSRAAQIAARLHPVQNR